MSYGWLLGGIAGLVLASWQSGSERGLTDQLFVCLYGTLLCYYKMRRQVVSSGSLPKVSIHYRMVIGSILTKDFIICRNIFLVENMTRL